MYVTWNLEQKVLIGYRSSETQHSEAPGTPRKGASGTEQGGGAIVEEERVTTGGLKCLSEKTVKCEK